MYLLDRLLIGSLVEARGCERFGLIAQALPDGPLKHFTAPFVNLKPATKTFSCASPATTLSSL